MGGLAAALGNSATPVTIDWKGRTFELKVSWAGVIDQLEKWLIKRERELHYETWKGMVQDGLMTVDEFSSRLTKFNDEAVNKGRYGFGSERMMAVFSFGRNRAEEEADGGQIKTPEGKAGGGQNRLPEGSSIWAFMKFLSLIMNTDMDTASTVFADQPEAVLEAVNELLSRSMPTQEESKDAPK